MGGVTSMLLGSPPPAAPPAAMLSPGHLAHHGGPYVSPQMMSPGPMLRPHPMEFAGMAAQMQQAAAAASMFQQWAGGEGGYGPDAGGMPHAMHATPPPRARPYGGRPGYSPGPGPRSGGYRGTPGGNRMSRFAPPDAVAAF